MPRPVSVPGGKRRNVYLSDAQVLQLKLIGGTASNGIRVLLEKEAKQCICSSVVGLSRGSRDTT